MTSAESQASAISLDKLVWIGPLVTAAVPQVLRFELSGATFSGTAVGAAAGTVLVGEAGFGAPLGNTPLVGEVMSVADQTADAGNGCEPFNDLNTAAVRNRIAPISRGTCGFVVKVKNAQNAGARGVRIQDNVAEIAIVPAGLGGADPTITIPAVRIFQSDGNLLREGLKRRSRNASGVFVSLGLVIAQYAGADPLGRAQMFAPNPFHGGSSVSHYDTSMFRNQLTEPAINGDLTQSLIPPQDLTFRLFQDIGW